MRILEALIKLLVALVELARRLQQAREEQAHDQRARDLQDDPPAWFADHFNGTPAAPGGAAELVRLPDASDLPGAAADASETDAAQPARKQSGRD